MTIKGKLVATAVAGLFASATPFLAHAQGTPTGDKKVKCEGVNACKGKSGCKSAKNECKGKNGCKGKGWIETTEKECKDKGGTIVAEAPKK